MSDTTQTITTDRSAFLRMHAAVWGQQVFPAGSVLVIASRGEQYRVHGSVPVADAAGAWKLLDAQAKLGRNTYITLNPRSSAPEAGRMGRNADVEMLAGLFVDIDCSDGEHAAGDENPTRAEAEAWIASAYTPTLVLNTGGGFHLWYALETPVEARSEIGIEVLARHRSYWMNIAAAAGRNIDVGPLDNIAQAPRAAGTWNSKQGRPVELISADGPTHPYERILRLYPAPDGSTLRTRRDGSTVRTAPAGSTPTRVLDPGASIGDKFAVECPVGDLAYSVFNTNTDERGGVTFPRSDGTIARDANATLYDDGEAGEQRLTAYGSRVIGALGLDGQNNSLTSWSLLGISLGGDFKRAALILAATQEDDGSWGADLFEAVRNVMDPTIAEAFGIDQDPDYTVPAAPAREYTAPTMIIQPAAPVTDTIVETLTGDLEVGVLDESADGGFVGMAGLLSRAGEVTGDDIYGQASAGTELAEPTLTVVDALLNRIPGKFKVDHTKVVFLNNYEGRHGIYRRTRDQDTKQESFVRLTDWVLLKSKNTEERIVGESGDELASTDVTVTLAFSGANGYIKVMPGFTLEQAHSIRVAIDMLNVDVMIPERDADSRSVTNVIRVLAATGGGAERTYKYGSLGWMNTGNGWVYLAPAGSITASGSTQAFAVGAPPKSDEGALSDLQSSYGWANTPQTDAEIRDAAQAIPEYLAITPTKPASYAALGVLWAAPMAFDRRTTVFLAGPPDNGKSLCAGGVQAFLTGISASSSWTGGPIAKTSAFAASIVTAWARHGVSIWDDYRVDTKNPQAAAIMHTSVSTILQAAYGNAGVGPKGKQDGGMKAVRSSSSAAIVTGEGLPEEAGVVSRAVTVHLGNGDVAMTPMFHSQYDRFANEFAEKAHLVYAAYLQWLARRLDAHGTLAKFRAANGRLRASLAVGDGRSVEGVSFISVGWAMFAEFAAEVGIDPNLFPSTEERAKIALELSGTNESLVGESSPALKIIKTARDMLAGGAGHMIRADGETPRQDELRPFGWKIIDGFQGTTIRADGMTLGVVSADRQWVVLTANAVSEIAKRTGLGSVPQDQLKNGFLPLVMEGTKPSERSPRSVSPSRPRGYTLPASMFDLDLTAPGTKAAADIDMGEINW